MTNHERVLLAAACAIALSLMALYPVVRQNSANDRATCLANFSEATCNHLLH